MAAGRGGRGRSEAILRDHGWPRDGQDDNRGGNPCPSPGQGTVEQAKARSIRIALAAPTGKAAARLQEAIREAAGRLACADGIRAKLAGMEASTLHRLLGRRPRSFARFTRGEEEMLPYDAVVVDEASMVSLQLLYSLVRALPQRARLILLGDRDQLASVEAGAVLGDICGPDRKPQYSRAFRRDDRSRKRPERPAHAAGRVPIPRRRLHRRAEAQLPLRRRKRHRRACPTDQGRGRRRGALHPA